MPTVNIPGYDDLLDDVRILKKLFKHMVLPELMQEIRALLERANDLGLPQDQMKRFDHALKPIVKYIRQIRSERAQRIGAGVL